MRMLSPVFGKEMITLARRKRHYFSRALFLSVLLTTIWLAWHEAILGAQYMEFTDLSYAGRELFQTFTLTQLFAVIFLVPALTAPVIAVEKDRDTLGLLLMSNLSRHNILLDKLVSRILLVGLLLVSGLPVFLVLLAFGGITVQQILTSYIMIFSTMIFCCGIGLFVSTRSANMHGALIGTYVVLAGYVVGIFVAWFLIMIIFPFPYVHYNMMAFPFLFLPVVSIMEDHWQIGPSFGFLGRITFPFISVLVFILSIRRCANLLPKVAGSTGPPWIKRRFDRMNRFFQRINFTRVNLMNDNLMLEGSPVMWRETQKRFSCSRTFLFRLTYIIVGLFFLVYFAWASDSSFACVVSSIHLLILTVVTIILSATTFVTDKEKHTLDLLLCTPVRSASLVAGKFLGVLKPLSVIALVPLVLPLTNLVPAWRLDEWEWERGLALLTLTILTYLPPAIIIGLYFSAKLRRSGTAVASTFLVLLFWYLSPPLIDFVASAQGVSTWWLEFLPYLSPIGWLYHIFSECAAKPIIFAAIPGNIAWILLLVLFVRRFDEIIGRQ